MVGMGDLSRCLGEVGLRDVETYLRSGNVVFESKASDRAVVRDLVESTIEDEFGFAVPVILVTAADLAKTVKANPYADAARKDPTRVHVMFLAESSSQASLEAIDTDGFEPEELSVGSGVVYLHLPNGMGRSKQAQALAKPASGIVGTARNWRTVTRLMEMLGDG
jgi:uncharacterized protein (DUF1697 family)